MPPQSKDDLAAARKKATFDPAALTRLLNEGSRDGEMRVRIAKVLESESAFDKSKRCVGGWRW